MAVPAQRRFGHIFVPLKSSDYLLYGPGLEVACWPLVPKFAGSNPAEAVGFFGAKKILSMPSFGREVKPFVPCRRFNVTCKSGIFRQNLSAISRPSSFLFHY